MYAAQRPAAQRRRQSGTGIDSGCLGFAWVTRAVCVAGVGVAAKEPQQLTPQQLTQRSWPQFTIVRRGGSGAGQGGSGAAAAAVVQRRRQWRSGRGSGAAAAAVAQRREALAQRR